MKEAPSPDVARPHGRRVLRRYWIEGALIFVFWGTLALLRVTQNVDDPLGGGPRADAMSAGAILYTFLEYGLWLVATPLIFWLAGRLSLEGRQWPLRLLAHVAAAVGGSVAIDLASHAIWNAVGEGHIRPISVAFVLRDFHFLPELLLYLIVLATGFARSYFLRYRERVNEAARLRAEAAELHAHSAELQAQLSEAHLQALRMQLNPHFLFNTLNTISAYVEQDPPGVRRMIARLSELLRYTLETTKAREVPLQQELGFIEGYLEIQRIRLEERLDVRRNVDPDVLDALVPNLILQPLVENAIKHGINQSEKGGRIELSAWREGENLHLSVRDDGPGLSSPAGDGATAGSQGIGLRNTRERMKSLYGEAQQFSLRPADGCGIVAHLVLPYHTSTDLYTTALSNERSPGTSAARSGRPDEGEP